MKTLMNILTVGLGGALGSMMRYGVTLLAGVAGWSGNLATMAVNIIGSFAIGYLSGAVKDAGLLLLLTVGICGGFTTFSTFSLQSVRLLQEGRIGDAVLYIAGSMILCIIFAALGWKLAAIR